MWDKAIWKKFEIYKKLKFILKGCDKPPNNFFFFDCRILLWPRRKKRSLKIWERRSFKKPFEVNGSKLICQSVLNSPRHQHGLFSIPPAGLSASASDIIIKSNLEQFIRVNLPNREKPWSRWQSNHNAKRNLSWKSENWQNWIFILFKSGIY